MMGLVCVILNHRNHLATEHCLRTLRASSDLITDVLIVDNGSGKEDLEELKKIELPFQLVSLTENRGFAGGMNAGIDVALRLDPKFVVLMNNDLIVTKGSIDLLGEVARKVPSLGLVVPNQLYHRSQLTGINFENPPPLSGEPEYRLIRQAGGFCWLITREAIDSVGVLDESFFFGREDNDYCIRLRNSGFGIAEVPRALVYHALEGTDRAVDRESATHFRLYHMSRGRGLLLRKYHSGVALPLLSYLDLIALSRDFVAVSVKRGLRVRNLSSIAKGYVAGLQKRPPAPEATN